MKELYKSEEKEVIRLKDLFSNSNQAVIHGTGLREGRTKSQGVEAFYIETKDKVIVVYKNNRVGEILEKYKEDLIGHDFTIKLKKTAKSYFISEITLDDVDEWVNDDACGVFYVLVDDGTQTLSF